MADLFNDLGSVLVPNLDPNAPLPGLNAPVTVPIRVSPQPVVPIQVSPRPLSPVRTSPPPVVPVTVSPRPLSPRPLSPVVPVTVSPRPLSPVRPPIQPIMPIKISPTLLQPNPTQPIRVSPPRPSGGRLDNVRDAPEAHRFFRMFAGAGMEVTCRLYRNGQMISQLGYFFNMEQIFGFQASIEQMVYWDSPILEGTTLTYETAETGEFIAENMIEDEFSSFFPGVKAQAFMNEDPVALRRNSKRAVWISHTTINDVPGTMMVYQADAGKARELGINIPWQSWQPFVEGVTQFDARYMKKLDLYWSADANVPCIFTFDADEPAYDFIRGVATCEQLFEPLGAKVGAMHRTRNLKLPFVFSYDLSTSVRQRPTSIDNFANQPPIAKIMMNNVEMAGFANFVGGHNRIVGQRGEPTLVVELVEPALTLLLHGDDDELRRQWNSQHMGLTKDVFSDFWINKWSAQGNYFYDPQGVSFLMKVSYNNGYGKVPQVLLPTYLYGVKVAYELYKNQFGGKELFKLYPLKGADGNFVLYS